MDDSENQDDDTKLWPENVILLEMIGKMILNRLVDKNFAEEEQIFLTLSLSSQELILQMILSYREDRLLIAIRIIIGLE